MLLRMAGNLNLIDCLFLEFFNEYFQTTVDIGQQKLQETKLQIRGRPLYLSVFDGFFLLTHLLSLSALLKLKTGSNSKPLAS